MTTNDQPKQASLAPRVGVTAGRAIRGTTRRGFIRAGVLGGLGVSLADLLKLEACGAVAESARGRSAIFIYLNGGQSHLESWDLKPDGGEVAGEFKPISTNVAGLQICEHMPRLAAQADKYCVLRGIKDAIGAHRPAQLLMRTGNRAVPSLSYPDVGSVVAKQHRSPVGIPPFVSLPVGRKIETVASPGYLGVAYGAFRVNEDPNADDFSIRALSSPEGMSLARVSARMELMKQLDTVFRDVDRANENLDGMDRFYQQAFDILQSEKTREAFDLNRESDTLRDHYGRTSLGQACLLARRLIEVGVRCVTIDFGGWDTHQKNFSTMKDELLPPWDAALAALLEDLHDRELLDDTFVWSTGEMGRTPTINKNAGRDHWGKAMSMVMAGGGVRGGQVLGQTDEKGAEVTEVAGTPEDAAASALRALGIDHKKEFQTSTGRPITIVRNGDPIADLFG